MRTLISDPPPVELQELLARRRKLGLDRKDEVWEGVLHLVPAPELRHARITQQLAVIFDVLARAAGLSAVMAEFNLGDSDEDFRVPDGGLLDPGATGVWLPTAALVVEILSPGDETWEKLAFYAAHEVDELLIVDPDEKRVHWLSLADGRYVPVERSGLIELGPAELVQRIDWP
jgi:Uma2 family endonuclease